MTKEELIAKMAASAGITKVAAGNALHAFTGAVTSSLKKRTASVAGQLRDLHDFQAQGQDGTESADGGEPQNSRCKSAEVLSRESFEVGCPVTSGSPLTRRIAEKREGGVLTSRARSLLFAFLDTLGGAILACALGR